MRTLTPPLSALKSASEKQLICVRRTAAPAGVLRGAKQRALYAAIGLIASLFVTGQCNLLALEDKTARGLGVNVTRSRIIISVIAVALASISTAIIGPISFLGLIVPHIARLLVGQCGVYARGH
mgnify:CR=1 FL=1